MDDVQAEIERIDKEKQENIDQFGNAFMTNTNNPDDDDDLGRYLLDECGVLEVPDYLKSYIDYEAYGRDARLESNLTYTSYGCLFDNR